MSTDANLPSDVRDSDLDPEICESCQVLSNRIEDMQDALSDALEFLIVHEVNSRWMEFSTDPLKKHHKELLACIERVKKLA